MRSLAGRYGCIKRGSVPMTLPPDVIDAAVKAAVNRHTDHWERNCARQAARDALITLQSELAKAGLCVVKFGPCDDEGCPQYGTKHVCIWRNSDGEITEICEGNDMIEAVEPEKPLLCCKEENTPDFKCACPDCKSTRQQPQDAEIAALKQALREMAEELKRLQETREFDKDENGNLDYQEKLAHHRSRAKELLCKHSDLLRE